MVCTMIFTASWLPSLKDSLDNLQSEYELNTFDLQLFAGEKTEEATPKRKEESRQKGQVAKSQEITMLRPNWSRKKRLLQPGSRA